MAGPTACHQQQFQKLPVPVAATANAFRSA